LETVKCQICGDEILIVPDAKAMAKAVKNHARRKHKALQYEVEDCLMADIIKIVGKEAP
jgi:thiazole synthase ThiGH ThiG subunit